MNFFFAGLSPSTSGNRLISCRCKQRCSDDRLTLSVIATQSPAHCLAGHGFMPEKGATDVGSKAAMNRGDHPAAAACAAGTQRSWPPRQASAPWILHPSARSDDRQPRFACATWPRSSGSAGKRFTGSFSDLPHSRSAPKAPSGSLHYSVLLDGLPQSSWRCPEESVP